MNENIINFLNRYVADPDPQYAVLLEGKWGCGKTFFINNWLNAQQKSQEGEIAPIYVSLFGLKTIGQLNIAINNILFPLLNSKAFKIGKGICKAIAGGMLKINCDIDNDGVADGTVDFKLDPLMSIFQGGNDDIKGNRLIVFDDIERTCIDMVELLGYINLFVERNKFKVVLICNSSEIKEKTAFAKFKEKVVGRTFEIKSDVDSAIHSFLNDAPVCYFTQEHEELIKDVFRVIGYSNLRVLRQCIRDFNSIFQLVNYQQDNLYHKKVVKEFLVRFIVICSEMTTDNCDIIANWRRYYSIALGQDSEQARTLKAKISGIQQKYENLENRLDISIFSSINDINLIPAYFLRGYDISQYVNASLRPTERPSWDWLYEYYNLPNEEFERYYSNAVGDIMAGTGRFSSYQDHLKAISIVIEIHDLGIKLIPDEVFEKSKGYIYDLLMSQQTNETFNEIRSNATRILSSINQNNTVRDKHRALFTEFNKWVSEKQYMLDNKFQGVLENLSDDNIEQLLKSSGQLLSAGRTYQYSSIFKTCDAEKIANCILQLSNVSKAKLYRFLNSRYRIETAYRLESNLSDDVPVLIKLRELLKSHLASLGGIDKYNVNSLIELIDKIEILNSRL